MGLDFDWTWTSITMPEKMITFHGKMSGRNYKQQPSNKAAASLKCFMCNKKYRSEERRKKHVEQVHYHETRNANWYKFDEVTRARICDLAIEYLKGIVSGQTYECLGTVANQQRFTQRLLSSNILKLCDWNRALDDLQRFFNLGIPYYDTNFCPNLLIDFLWHALMLDDKLYTQLCQSTIGYNVPHCAEERTEESDQLRYAYFNEVYRHRYGSDPYLPNSNSINNIVNTSISTILMQFLSTSDNDVVIANLTAQAQKERQIHQDRLDAEKLHEEEYLRRQEQIRQQREQKLERQGKILDEFCAETCVSINWYQYDTWYKDTYRRTGYVGDDLKNEVNRLIRAHEATRDRRGSTC